METFCPTSRTQVGGCQLSNFSFKSSSSCLPCHITSHYQLLLHRKDEELLSLSVITQSTNLDAHCIRILFLDFVTQKTSQQFKTFQTISPILFYYSPSNIKCSCINSIFSAVDVKLLFAGIASLSEGLIMKVLLCLA